MGRKHPVAAAAVLLLALILTGCNGLMPGDRGVSEPLTAPPPAPSRADTLTPSQSTTTSTGTSTPAPVASTPAAESSTPGANASPAAGGATPGAGGLTFQNPVLRADFPDPFLLHADDGYWYAYATNGSGKNIQEARSKDLLNWEIMSDAMPALPTWAKLGGSLVWAPEVAKVAQEYALYYTARDKASNKQCVGVATAAKPDAKFKDASDKPLVCQANEGGTIDPDPFQDGNKLYLYFKNDGNCCGFPTYIYVQELASDGLKVVGEPKRLIRNDQAWEGRVIEAPTMVKHDGKYYLFFSANNYAGVEYSVGYANCETATGPCTDAPENPILKSQMQPPPNMVVGPGHEAVIQVGNQDWIVYHAWEITPGGQRGDRRLMYMNRLDWQNGKPVVVGPLTGPQPAPESTQP